MAKIRNPWNHEVYCGAIRRSLLANEVVDDIADDVAETQCATGILQFQRTGEDTWSSDEVEPGRKQYLPRFDAGFRAHR